MTDQSPMLVRVHDAFIERPFQVYGGLLIAAELVFALVTLTFADLGDHWEIVLYQVLGIGAIVLALLRHEAGQSGDRFLMYLGALAAIIFLYIFIPPLGVLGLVIWGIVILIALVM